MPAYWSDVEHASAVVALAGVPYLVLDKRRRQARFAFEFPGCGREQFERDNLTFGRATFRGTIRNLSLEPNTIERVYLLVWRTPAKKATLRYGYGDVTVTAKDGSRLGPPIALKPREAQFVSVVCEFPLTGTEDARLFTSTSPSKSDPRYAAYTYEYELAFQDVAGRLFDARGLPRSAEGLGLRWTLDNSWNRLKDGHPLPFVRHLGAIAWDNIRFRCKRLLRVIGF